MDLFYMSYTPKYSFFVQKPSTAALRQLTSDQQLTLCEMWQHHYATGILLVIVRLCKNAQLLNLFYLFQVMNVPLFH